jgi:hypothetical protein
VLPLRAAAACTCFFFAELDIGAEPKRSNEPRQCQPLPQEREYDDRDRHDEERLARGERPAVRGTASRAAMAVAAISSGGATIFNPSLPTS